MDSADVTQRYGDSVAVRLGVYLLAAAWLLFLAVQFSWGPRLRAAAQRRFQRARHDIAALWGEPRSCGCVLCGVWQVVQGVLVVAATLTAVHYATVYVRDGVHYGQYLHYYTDPKNLQLFTYQETHFELAREGGVSLAAPVRDPRPLSPHDARSHRTVAHFCGRPTASSYDGFVGAAHAAYIQHDEERDRYVVRTFGRGGTRVDVRRRDGVGRSTFEAFCSAPRAVQSGTPLAPSPWSDGEENWLLGSAPPPPRNATGAFDFAVHRVAVPHAAAAAAPAGGSADADFTRADQGLRTHYRRYTRAQLLQRHAHLDFVYSYVNGSDFLRNYLKPFARTARCWRLVEAAQVVWAEMQRASSAPAVSEDAYSRRVAELLFAAASSPCALTHTLGQMGATRDAAKRVEASLWWAATHPPPQGRGNASATAGGTGGSDAAEAAAPAEMSLTLAELLRALGADLASVQPDHIDSDSDDLRHSMRGLLQRTRRWHRGRVAVVSPHGHLPRWINASRNFFLRSLYADATAAARPDAPRDDADGNVVLGTAESRFVREVLTGTLHYARITVVDQRALMPPTPTVTANSFTIEPFIYRIRNASSLFVYMNDDYLVMRDVDVTDFVNQYGGPILRHALWQPMEYRGSETDEFTQAAAFNAMLLHRDLDKLPADIDELVEPATAAAGAASLERGVVRASWAGFAAAIDARLERGGGCAGGGNGTVCAWAGCAWAAAGGPQTRVQCSVPHVSVHGEPTWEADAAGTFVPVRAGGDWVWAGRVQVPELAHWGERVLHRLTADLVAPHYYLAAPKVVVGEEEATVPVSPVRASARVAREVAAAADLVRAIDAAAAGTTEADTARLQLLRRLETWAGRIASHELPTHRIMKTQPRLRRYHLRLDSHAPYTQCRNMWSYIHKRYAPDLNHNMIANGVRGTLDMLPPVMHSAHMLRHPWAASTQYLPYLMAKQAWRTQHAAGQSPLRSGAAVFPVLEVALDNEDGCAPATVVTEAVPSAEYHDFREDESANALTMDRLRQMQDNFPFTNINSKFTDSKMGDVLRAFWEELFPVPMLVEEHWGASPRGGKGTEQLRVSLGLDDAGGGPLLEYAHLQASFQRLARLPLVLVSNDVEGFCPLLRSMRHAMPAFRGRRVVHVLVPPADGVVLRAARAAQRHAYRHYVPVAGCGVAEGRLRRVTLAAGSSLDDVVVAGLRAAREGVAEAQWEAPALVELRGRRVARRAVQAVVLDARTLRGGARGFAQLPHALAVPAELVAHEDFAEHLLRDAARSLVRAPTAEEAAQAACTRVAHSSTAPPAPAAPQDFAASVLVLAEADAQARSTHWTYGASEHDLLTAMPLPYEALEDLDEAARWVF